MITKIYEFHKMLNERAFNIDDTDNCIMLRSDRKGELKLCLYDYVNKKIVGYITANKDERYNYFIIDRATSDKGWGPFIYKLMLYTVYPMGIKPSKLIRPAALNVWKQFSTNTDVKMSPVLSTDLNYADKWQPDVEVVQRDAPEVTKLINTLYTMIPAVWYTTFIADSNLIIEEQKIDVKNIFRDALDVWQYNYDSSRAVIAEGIGTTIKQMLAPVKDISDKYLLVNDKGSSIEFIIQDKSNIFGYAELIKKQSYYNIVNVAAEPSWGPFLYDTVMLYLDMPVRPNRSLSRDAWHVWNIYLNARPDVTKREINTDIWDTVDLDYKWTSNSTMIEPINYVYTITDGNRKNNIVKWSHDKLELPGNIDYDRWKDIRFNYAKKWFYTKYKI